MDQTVDILGLLDDKVGYTNTNDNDTTNPCLENNIVVCGESKTGLGINGINAKLSDDKKQLLGETKLSKPPFWIIIPSNKIEMLKLVGIVVAVIFSIILLYIIFTNKTKGNDKYCKRLYITYIYF